MRLEVTMKTLLKHEFKNLTTFVLIFLIGSVLIGTSAMLLGSNLKLQYISNYVAHPDLHNDFYYLIRDHQLLIIIFVIAIVYTQFRDIKDSNISEFILSLPFTAKTILISKMIAGVSIIAVAGIIFTSFWVGTYLYTLPISNELWAVLPGGETLADAYNVFSIVSMTFRFTLNMVAVYLFFVAGQMLIKRAGAAIIITFCSACAVPYLFGYLYDQFSHYAFQNQLENFYQSIVQTYIFAIDKTPIAYDEASFVWVRVHRLSFEEVSLIFTCLLLISLSLHLVNIVGFTRFSHFTCSKWLDATLKIMFTLCFALLPFYYSILFGQITGIMHLILSAVFAIAGYLFISKIIRKDLESEV